MGRFSKVEKVKASGDKLPNLPPGFFKVRISKCKAVDGHEGDLWFVVEFEILEADVEDGYPAVKVGRFYSWVTKWNTNMGPINVKRFALASQGLDPNDEANDGEVDDDFIETMVGQEKDADEPGTWLAGIEMDVQCDMIITKGKKEPFTKHTWYPIEDPDADPKDAE